MYALLKVAYYSQNTITTVHFRPTDRDKWNRFESGLVSLVFKILSIRFLKY